MQLKSLWSLSFFYNVGFYDSNWSWRERARWEETPFYRISQLREHWAVGMRKITAESLFIRFNWKSTDSYTLHEFSLCCVWCFFLMRWNDMSAPTGELSGINKVDFMDSQLPTENYTRKKTKADRIGDWWWKLSTRALKTAELRVLSCASLRFWSFWAH